MGIDKSELMIGNKVLLVPQGKRHHEIKPRICTVMELQKLTVLVDDMGLPLSLFYKSEDLQPIPLSPVILNKLGFTKEEDGDGGHYRELLSDNGILFVEGDKKGYTDVFVDCWEQIRVKSLHQLQNLYHSLTGKEIEYSPVK